MNGIKWGIEVKIPKSLFMRDKEYQWFSFWYIVDLKNNCNVSIDYFVFLEILEIKFICYAYNVPVNLVFIFCAV